ncbi:hypothetical protein Adt_23535 [Abeliophyllum distichum]|uniref:Uncharacterized protein n=1 Tax=Abeliophyllum distichum TaxID=126358 RepID=A0ABD1SBK9_9LAMI
MAGFYFSKISIFKIQGGKDVDEKETLPPRLLISSTTSVLASTFSPVVEVAGGVSSSLSTLRVASVLVTIVLLMVGVVGSDLSSLSEASMKPSEDIQHQDKEKGIIIDEGEKVEPKRTLEDKGDAVDSRRVKKGRMAALQETTKSIPTFPTAMQDPLPDSSD